IGTAFGHAVGVPVEVVVGSDRDIVTQLGRRGNVVLRQKQILGFYARSGGSLTDVQRTLTIVDTVTKAEYRLTPIYVMPTRTDIHRHIPHIQTGKHKGIKDLAGTLVPTFHLPGKPVVRIGSPHTS